MKPLTPAEFNHCSGEKLNRSSGPFSTKLLCKTFNELCRPDENEPPTLKKVNVNLEVQAVPCSDKFVLMAPFVTLWHCPISFYTLVSETGFLNAALAKKKDALRKFLTLRPIYTKRMSADLVNHQNVTFLVYMARSPEEHAIFQTIQLELKPFANTGLCETPFDDFLIQFNLPTIANSFSIKQLLKAAPACDFVTKIKRVEMQKEYAGIEHTPVFCIEPLKSAFDAPDYKDKIERLWREILHLDDERPGLDAYVFKVCSFDIEVGVENEENARKNVLPTILNGYVQCICFKVTLFRGRILNETSKNYQFAYVPEHFVSECKNIFEKINDKTMQRAEGDIYREDALQKKLLLFNDEEKMIRRFLHTVLTQCDFLVGYNSTRFDLPFLFMRANYLEDKKRLTTNFLQYFQLSNRFGNNEFRIAAHSKSFCAKPLAKCPTCHKSLALERSAYPLICVVCSSSNKGFDQCSIFWQEDPARFITFENVTNPGRNIDLLPFGAHIELMNSVMFRDLENRKLETVCNIIFREEVAGVDERPDGNATVWLAKKNVLNSYDGLLLVGMRLVLFRFNKVTNLKAVLCTGTFCGFKFRDETVGLEVCGIASSDEEGILPADDVIYISVGKTSSLSLVEQLYWQNLNSIVETVNYCIIDAHLANYLEARAQTILEILSAEQLGDYPLRSLFAKSGRKILPTLANSLVNDAENPTFQFIIKNPLQQWLFMTSMLVVEGVEAELPENQRHEGVDQSIVKIGCYETARTLMRFDDFNRANLNEFEIGTMGEGSLGDLNYVKGALKRLLQE
jgi:hypothetical protein